MIVILRGGPKDGERIDITDEHYRSGSPIAVAKPIPIHRHDSSYPRCSELAFYYRSKDNHTIYEYRRS